LNPLPLFRYSPRMKRILPRLLLSLAALVAGLFIAEWVARRATQRVIRQETERRAVGTGEASPDKIYINTPAGRRLTPGSSTLIRNHPVSGRDIMLVVNELGFRGNELPVPKPDHETRVLVLGDSITLGNYVAEADTWVQRAQTYIKQARPGDNIRLVNAGIDGIGTREQMDLLEEKVATVDPDYVLLAWYLNDSCPPDGFAGSIADPGWLRRHSILVETLYRRLKLREWMKERVPDRYGAFSALAADPSWRNDRGSFERLAAAASLDWGAAWQDEAWVTTQAQLERLKALAGRHRFRPAVVAFPVAFQVHADFVADEPQQRLGALAARAGMPFLDLLPELRRHREQPLLFDWCHPREEANDMIGRSVAEFLVGQVIGASSVPSAARDARPFMLYVLGESTAFGEPYHTFFDLGRLVSYLFGGTINGRPVIVHNLAGVGISSEDVLKTARDIPNEASLVLAYTGHNEFLDYDREHDLEKQKRAICDVPTVSENRREKVIEKYAANIEKLILLMKKKRVPLILSTQVSNTANWEPNRSVLDDRGNRATVERLVQEAELHLQIGNIPAAKESYLKVLESEPRFAWAHKRVGDCLFVEKVFDDARKHYVQARDYDGNPYRAMTRQNDILCDMAAKHGVPLVDAVARFRAQHSHGLVGFNIMLDNCHPTVRGYIVLADAYAEVIEKLLSAGPGPRGRRRPAGGDTIRDSERFFGLGPRQKAQINQVSGQYCYVHSTLIWNPKDRLKRADYYFDEAAAFENTADLLMSRAILKAIQGDAAGVRDYLKQAFDKNPSVARQRLDNPRVRQLMKKVGVDADGM